MFSLSELPGGTAPQIVDVILKVFTSRDIPLEKLCGVATDGANVMVGCRTSVTTQLKGKNPFILSIYCIAHRLALASGQGTDAVPYVKQYQICQHLSVLSLLNQECCKTERNVLQAAERKFH